LEAIFIGYTIDLGGRSFPHWPPMGDLVNLKTYKDASLTLGGRSCPHWPPLEGVVILKIHIASVIHSYLFIIVKRSK